MAKHASSGRARRSSCPSAPVTPRQTPDRSRSGAWSSSVPRCTPRRCTRPSRVWPPRAGRRPGERRRTRSSSARRSGTSATRAGSPRRRGGCRTSSSRRCRRWRRSSACAPTATAGTAEHHDEHPRPDDWKRPGQPQLPVPRPRGASAAGPVLPGALIRVAADPLLGDRARRAPCESAEVAATRVRVRERQRSRPARSCCQGLRLRRLRVPGAVSRCREQCRLGRSAGRIRRSFS